MPFTFSESEREDLKRLRDRARLDTDNGISGSYAAAYLYIVKRLTKQDSVVGFHSIPPPNAIPTLNRPLCGLPVPPRSTPARGYSRG